MDLKSSVFFSVFAAVLLLVPLHISQSTNEEALKSLAFCGGVYDAVSGVQLCHAGHAAVTSTAARSLSAAMAPKLHCLAPPCTPSVLLKDVLKSLSGWGGPSGSLPLLLAIRRRRHSTPWAQQGLRHNAPAKLCRTTQALARSPPPQSPLEVPPLKFFIFVVAVVADNADKQAGS